MTKLTWIFVIIGCIVNAVIEAFPGARGISMLGQLGILSVTGLVLVLFDRPVFKPLIVVASWLLQNIFLIVAMLCDAPEYADAEFERDDAFDRAFESLKPLLVRPMHSAVLILYVFTQGLSFKQTAFIMLPVYCLQEVASTVYFTYVHEQLDDYARTLLPRFSVILFVGLITLMCAYLNTLRQMQLFFSNRNMLAFNKNMANLFDKLYEEGIFVY